MFEKRTRLLDVACGKDRVLVMQAHERDGRTCQMCGAREGEASEFDGAALQLLARVLPVPLPAGALRLHEVRTVCSDCADGLAAMWAAEALGR